MTWDDARRLEGWAGEIRVNLIRAAALFAFYAHHLITAYVIGGDPTLRGTFHSAVTALAILWAIEIVFLHFCLVRRFVPPALKYLSTFADLLLVTGLLCLANGPGSPLVVLYLLVVASASLRLSLRLVWASTLGAMLAYTVLVGYANFYAPAPGDRGRPEARVARTSQVIFLLGLGAAGLLSGQAVRQARRIAQGYPVKVAEPKNDE